MAAKKKTKKNCVQGVGGAAAGGGGYSGGAPIKKNGDPFFFFTANQRARRALQVAKGHQPSTGARSSFKYTTSMEVFLLSAKFIRYHLCTPKTKAVLFIKICHIFYNDFKHQLLIICLR